MTPENTGVTLARLLDEKDREIVSLRADVERLKADLLRAHIADVSLRISFSLSLLGNVVEELEKLEKAAK